MSRNKINLLHEEAEMIAQLESEGYEYIPHESEEIQRYLEIFRESGNKVKRVNLRMTEWDIEKAQAMAMRQGVPFATLLASILHRYFTGQLKAS